MASRLTGFGRSILSFALALGLGLGGLMPGLPLLPEMPSAQAETIVPKITTFQLPTGQMLYVKEDHSQPIVTIDTWVKTGSVNETPEINGVSHFLEHLLFKGTPTHHAGEMDRILESRGAEFNAATSDDFTHFYITTATPYFEEALGLHADMMVNAAIPETELPQERKVVQEEINRANDNPDREIYIALAKLLYGNHGYAFDTLGPKQNIADIPRDSILAYYHYWYQPRNFNTIIVGDVNPEQVKELVAKAFPGPAYQQPEAYQPPKVGLVTPPTQAQSEVLSDPNVSQAYISVGMLGPAMQKPDDVYALDIAMLALGAGKSSRLYRALKEEQPLATSVGAGNYTQKYSGLLMVSAEAKPENRDAVKAEILTQIKTLADKGITQAELDKAKTQYLKDFIFENESTDGTASSIGYNVTIGSLNDYLDHVSRVEKVTLAQVDDALKRYLDLSKAVMVELLPTAMSVDNGREATDNIALLTPGGETQPAPTANAATTTSAAATVEPVKTILPNGMTLITKPRPDTATVAVKVFVKGGQGVEEEPGAASLLASLLMQGTASRSAEELSRELESRGMSLSFSADDDFIEGTGSAVSEDVGELLVILSDVLRHPAFADKEIAKKKEQIRQAIVSSRDNPSTVAFENLSLALYPDHPYGNEGKRVEESLGRISRTDLLAYYKRYFQPQNMVVSVVGNFDPALLASSLSALYPSDAKFSAKPVKIPPVPPLSKSRTVIEKKPKLSAVWMAQGWLAPSISEQQDYVTMKVLNSLLGTGMSSRLFVDLREKQGLAYVVGSMIPSRNQKSRFVIYIGTDPANLDKVRAGFKDEIERLKDEPVPEAELTEAKSKLIGSYALAHDTNVNQAFYLGLFETLGAGYGFDKTYPALVDTVTPEELQSTARRYFSAPSVFSMIQPVHIEPEPEKPEQEK